MTSDSTAVLAPGVAGERERHLVDATALGLVVVPDLDTVVRMDALCVRKAQVVFPEPILVPDELKPFLWLPQKLSS